jgi:hypothetical protein
MSKDDRSIDSTINHIRRSLDWVGDDEINDPHEFLNNLRVDLFEGEIFVFTPKGEVMSLRRDATPLDFAYAVHTEVGNHCVGAKVNGAVVPLTYRLQMGDRVEILVNKNAHPSRDWMNVVVTPSARETDEAGRRATLPDTRSTHAGLRSTGPRSSTVAFSNGGVPSARSPSNLMTYTGVDCRSKRSTKSLRTPTGTVSHEMRRTPSRKYAFTPPSGRGSSVPTSSSPQTESARPDDNSAAASEARQTDNARAVICRFPS